MSMFMSTINGRIDAKGRVSVPSMFRSAIAAQNAVDGLGVTSANGQNGIFVYPSFTEAAIEGGGQSLMGNISRMVERLDLFTEERDALAASLFADSYHLTFDADGRVILPEAIWITRILQKSFVLQALARNSKFGNQSVLKHIAMRPAKKPWRAGLYCALIVKLAMGHRRRMVQNECRERRDAACNVPFKFR